MMSLPISPHTAVPVSPKRRNSDGDAALPTGEAQEQTPLLASRRPLTVKNSNRSVRTQVIAALVAFIVFWLLLLNGGTFTVFLPLADPSSASPFTPIQVCFLTRAMTGCSLRICAH